jgi:hypothetical protein
MLSSSAFPPLHCSPSSPVDDPVSSAHPFILIVVSALIRQLRLITTISCSSSSSSSVSLERTISGSLVELFDVDVDGPAALSVEVGRVDSRRTLLDEEADREVEGEAEAAVDEKAEREVEAAAEEEV